MPKVSVIIPVYNVEKYLRQCLDSVVNQTLQDIEIICVDDGSTDNSLNILKEYASKDNRIKIIEQENQGAGVARNKGINIAHGEYLYFLDSDDYVDINILQKLYLKSKQYDADICLSNRQNLNEKTQTITIAKETLVVSLIPENKEVFSIADFQEHFFQFCGIAIFCKLYKKDFLKKNNILFQNLKTCNDVYFHFATLSLAKDITYVNEALVTSRRNRNGSLTSNRGKYIGNIIIAMNEVKRTLKKHNLYNKVKNSFFARCEHNFIYELKKCNNNYQRAIFVIKCLKLLSSKQKQLFIVQYFLPIIFSVINEKREDETKHKIITILGLRIKIRKK